MTWACDCRFQKDLLTVNLDTLAARLKEGRLQPGAVITMRTLQEAGIIGKQVTSGVKLLGKVSTCPSANSMLVMKLQAVWPEPLHCCMSQRLWHVFPVVL